MGAGMGQDFEGVIIKINRSSKTISKCTLKLLACFVFSGLFFSISLLKKGQYFHISLNLGVLLEQIPLNSENSKELEAVILGFTY